MKLQYGLSSVLAFLTTLAVLPAVSLGQSNNQPSKKINPIESIAKELAVHLSTTTGNGSGVLIGKEGDTYTVLSAAHVICDIESNVQSCQEPAAIELTTPDGETYTSSEVKEFPFQLDLVLIKFRSSFKYPIAKMGESTKIKRGDQLFSSGFTGAEEWNFYEGKLIANASKKLTPGGHDLLHNANTIPGMSGGGIYNAKGELVCINSQGEKPVSASSCVPIAFYREFDPQIEKTASELYLLGKQEYYNRNYNEAIKHLSHSISKDSSFAEAYFLRGECYYNKANYKAAFKSYEKASILNPNMSEALVGRGKAAYELGNYASALESFQKILVFQPENISALQWQGLIFYNQADYDQAIKILVKAIELNDNLEYSHDLLGDSYEKNGQVAQAVASYTRAIDIGGSTSDSLVSRARVHFKNKSYYQAIQDYNLLLARKYNPKKVEHHWSRSTAAIAVQDYNQALVDMDAIIQINQNYRPAYLRKAQTHEARQEYSQAVAYYSDFIYRFLPVPRKVNSSPDAPLISGDAIGSSSIATANVPSANVDTAYDASQAAGYRGRALAYIQQKQYQSAAGDLKIAAELYRQDNKPEEEQFCLNTLQNLPKITKPRTVRSAPRRK